MPVTRDEDERGRVRLTAEAELISEDLLAFGVLELLPEPDEHGRMIRLAPALQQDFALNQPLASALEAFELVDPESENYALSSPSSRRSSTTRFPS